MPEGRATLKLVIEEHQDESQKSDPSQFPDGTQALRMATKTFKGIKCMVAFDGANEVPIKQLSGGQKTVVVVSMIFAVLKLESAPFYILDEFDHALDAQYRTAIASVIADLSSKSQFFITTFKPELLQVPASIYQVSYSARKSTFKKIDKEKAAEII